MSACALKIPLNDTFETAHSDNLRRVALIISKTIGRPDECLQVMGDVACVFDQSVFFEHVASSDEKIGTFNNPEVIAIHELAPEDRSAIFDEDAPWGADEFNNEVG